jgi:hypothetical protein
MFKRFVSQCRTNGVGIGVFVTKNVDGFGHGVIRFAIILVLNNPEISKINKEYCYHVRILLVLGVIRFAKSTKRPNKNNLFVAA